MSTGFKKDFEKAVKNLQREIARVKGGTLEGLIRAVYHIRNETEKTQPYTPVDVGNLRASWFTVTAKGAVPDPLLYAGRFRKNPRWPVSTYQMWRQQALNEGRGKSTNDLAKGALSIIFGYSAHYASYVHENIGARFSKEGSDAKWFEEHINNSIPEIKKIIQKYAKIK